MPRLHLFNPENDIALGLGKANFTPPKGAVAISIAGAALPCWWAEKDDAVLINDIKSVERAEIIKQEYGLFGEIVTKADPDMMPDPWGWSSYTRRLFIATGIVQQRCPSEERLDNLRLLSHRRTTIAIHRLLNTPEELIPVEATTVDDALRIIDKQKESVIKLPWSSSGRGVIYSSNMTRRRLEQQITGMIRHQGSVMVEHRYDRLRDFAALFMTSGGHVSFQGLSMFSTDATGFYTGNIIAPQKYIAGRIDAPIEQHISNLQNAIESVIAPHYNGWLGVDMLVYRDISGEQIAPCIEINLRRTMGVAALLINRRLGNTIPMRLSISPSDGIIIKGL